MGKIIIKNQIFTFASLKNNILSMQEGYELETLQFCKEWLAGKDVFRISTSGSTGIPKEIELNRTQMEFSAMATIKALKMQKDDHCLVCINTSFIGGKMILVRAMMADMNIYIVPPDANPIQHLDTTIKIDFVSFVPLQIQKILDEDNPNGIETLNSMKGILIGGAPLNETLVKRLSEIKSPVYHSYGMTETVSHVAIRRVNGEENQHYFQTLEDIVINVDDRNCLMIKAPCTNNISIQTNDIVHLIDKDKFIWLGRADSIINSGGIKIQSEKIESTIGDFLRKRKVSNFFITGLPHPLLGEAVTLFIEGVLYDSEEFDKVLNELLSKYEIPKATINLDKFPILNSGKIDKMSIKKTYENYWKA